MRVLVLNPGSSSLKSSVVDSDSSWAAALARLDVDWGVDATQGEDPAGDIRRLLARLDSAGIPASSLDAVGYRVVHGGSHFLEPVRVDEGVVEQVRELRVLAPLHNEIAAQTMRAGLRAVPDIPHVAVFDTAFHASLPPEAFRYPAPEEWYRDVGIRRYGFHGLSVAWSVGRASELLRRPTGDLGLIVAHLGSGCSVTAVSNGASVDTSMGMTPLEGLMMGTRAGSLDPGILLRLLRERERTLDELADDLDHRSGLLGVSGQTSDVRELLSHADAGDERAGLALAMFVRHAAAFIAAAATTLDRLDGLVFTGGIGENAGRIRASIVGRLGRLGIAPIAADAVGEDAILSREDAPIAVLRIEAREDVVVAREVARLLGAPPAR